MADKSRTINTKFWDDQFVQELTPTNKLLFLYLLTNPLTNLMGVYEISIKRIIFDTGINSETISKGFECFAKHNKIIYEDGFIFISNFLKNQNLNPNMKKGVEKLFDNLPNDIQDKILGNGSKGFESISNGMLKLKGKLKEKEEIESEKEIEKTIVNLYHEICVSLPKVETLSNGRISKIKTRHKELKTIDAWKNIFARTEQSDFLTGVKSDWIASLDWIIENDTNWLKIVEGKYDNKKDGYNTPTQNADLYGEVKQ